MSRLPQLLGMVVLGLAFLVSAGVSQDAKKEDKKEEKKKKPNLPQGFKDLGLSAEQKTQIYTIMSDYYAKISDLDKQMKELKKKEQQEIVKVLSEEQREKYLKAKGFDSKDKKSSEKDKATDKDKDKKKDS